MTQIGALLAVGRTSDVYEFGRGEVVKVPRPGVPAHWAAIEAEITATVHDHGLPTPAVRGLERIDDRESVVFERVDGPSMWQQVMNGARSVTAAATDLAAVQAAIHAAGAPNTLRPLTHRLRRKIDAARLVSIDERHQAHQMLDTLPAGSVLCHGDLHPGNILMSKGGPMVIDWFDAAVGDPVADVARTSLLIRPRPGPSEVPHLPGSTPDLLHPLHQAYLTAALAGLGVTPSQLGCWEAVLAVSRLSEQAESDDSALVALWRGEVLSPLVEAMSPGGVIDHEHPE